jgi:hypothetical protein
MIEVGKTYECRDTTKAARTCIFVANACAWLCSNTVSNGTAYVWNAENGKALCLANKDGTPSDYDLLIPLAWDERP